VIRSWDNISLGELAGDFRQDVQENGEWSGAWCSTLKYIFYALIRADLSLALLG